MRTELQKHDKEVIEVTATFRRFATTNNRKNFLFKHVCLNGVEITDHIWIQHYKNEKKIKLEKHAEYKLIRYICQYLFKLLINFFLLINFNYCWIYYTVVQNLVTIFIILIILFNSSK